MAGYITWKHVGGHGRDRPIYPRSGVRRMDSLVVLDWGRIVEQGSHENLLALGGIYASLWSHQSGGFLPATDVEGVAVSRKLMK